MHSDSSSSKNNLNRIKAWSQALKLPIMRKTVGIIEGQHPSVFKGIGLDFEELALYQPGDSIKDIDWKVSARSQSPVIRRYRANANTDMVFILDSGKEIVTRATSGERKIEIMRTVCNTFGYLGSMRYDGVGIVAGDNNRIMNERAKLNFNEVNLMLNRVEKMTNSLSPMRNYARVLAYCNQYFTKRSFMVLVFDEVNAFHVQDQFLAMVRKLKERHDVFCVSIRSINPFKKTLPKINGRVIDISNYTYVPAYYRTQKISEISKKNILTHRAKIAEGMNRMGVPHINVTGSEDFYHQFAAISQRREVAKL
jgi:uncharacterized protein (DUF58 family)